jgi:hypothetical protein
MGLLLAGRGGRAGANAVQRADAPALSASSVPALPERAAEPSAPAAEPSGAPRADDSAAAPRPKPPVASSAHPARTSLSIEIALLDEARSALRDGDVVRARDALDRYARQVRHGQLSEDAAVLRAKVAAASHAKP